jgi:hypothetical protein
VAIEIDTQPPCAFLTMPEGQGVGAGPANGWGEQPPCAFFTVPVGQGIAGAKGGGVQAPLGFLDQPGGQLPGCVAPAGTGGWQLPFASLTQPEGHGGGADAATGWGEQPPCAFFTVPLGQGIAGVLGGETH